jgi:phage tail P2-like protein
MMADHLLPPNATTTEIALAQTFARTEDLPTPARLMWNPDTCPLAFLPWLAWSLSVDEWDADWPEETKRAVIRESIGIHRQKGTLWAVRRALAAAGYGDAIVTEFYGVDFYNGAYLFDGTISYVDADHWAEYRIRMLRPLSIAQAAQVRRILDKVAPARCVLKLFDFSTATNLYNAAITYNGAFTHGVV